MNRKTVIAATFLIQNLANASVCLETVSLQSKTLKVVSTYTTKGMSDGYAIKGPNGTIWTGTTDGVLRELDPSTSNRVISERTLTGGIQASLKKFGNSVGNEKIVVGTGNGYHCFRPDGSEISHKDDLGITFSKAPINHGADLIFTGEDGLLYKLDKSCTSFSKVSEGVPHGTLTSAPAVLRGPSLTLIYGTEYSGASSAQERKYSLVFAQPERPISYFDLAPEDGRVDFPPLVTRAPGEESDLVLIMTNKGKILPAGKDGLKRTKSTQINLHCIPTAPLTDLGNGRLSTICVDPIDRSTKSLVITSTGKEVSRSTIRNFDDSAMRAQPTSEAVTFLDSEKRHIAIMGFSDSSVKVIDVQTGVVLESFKTARTVKTRPSYIGGSDFFISEETGDPPLELTKAYLVKLTKPAVVQTKTTQAPSICSAGESNNESHIARQPSS